MTRQGPDKPAPILALIVAQALCAAFFLWDVLGDGLALGWRAFLSSHFMIEAISVIALIAAIVFELRYLQRLLRRKAHLERQVSLAAGAFHDIIEARFEDWALTPSEMDVALFTIKGLSITEIAALRGSAEGTVKSHLNAIYRKAGVTGRGAFLSLFIEDLVESHPLMPDVAPRGSGTNPA